MKQMMECHDGQAVVPFQKTFEFRSSPQAEVLCTATHITELMGSSLRTREAIALGEDENRRLADIIEAGNTSGWHSFEQSLLKAFEQDLITEETALLSATNKTQMLQRIEAAKKRLQGNQSSSNLKIRTDQAAPRSTGKPPLPGGLTMAR